MENNNTSDSGILTIALGIAGLIGGALLGACLENTSKGQQVNQTLGNSCKKVSNGYKRLPSK